MKKNIGASKCVASFAIASLVMACSSVIAQQAEYFPANEAPSANVEANEAPSAKVEANEAPSANVEPVKPIDNPVPSSPTGTRIQRPSSPDEVMPEVVVVDTKSSALNEYNSATPLEVITTESSARAGLLSVTSILQGSTLVTGQQLDDSFSEFVNSGGDGANTVSLRGLGSQRSLVIVNGKRWVPSGVRGAINAVDLTSLPEPLVSRFEILKDGASSIYGADAVAGVINVITDRTLEGSQVNLAVSAPEIGAGDQYHLDAAWGSAGDNWTFGVFAGYRKRNDVTWRDLDYAQCETRPRREAGANRDPETGEDLCFGFEYGTAFISKQNTTARYEPTFNRTAQDDPNFDSFFAADAAQGGFATDFFTRVPVNTFGNLQRGGSFDDASGINTTNQLYSEAFYRDLRRYDTAQIQTKGENFSFSSFGEYDFAAASIYYELYYDRRETSSNSGFRQLNLLIPENSPVNVFGFQGPRGEQLAQALADLMVETPPPNFFETVNNTTRLFVPTYELLNADQEVEVDRVNFFAGIKGNLSDSWTYDSYIGVGRSEGNYRSENFLENRVRSLLNETTVGLSSEFFTEDFLLNGRASPELRDFITTRTEGETTYTMLQLAGYTTGQLFTLPAGPVSGVAGFEVRYEAIDDQPDQEFQSGNIFSGSSGSSAGVTKGSDTVQELYLELETPLLRDSLMAEELTVNVSGRFTNYRTFGSDFTYRLAANWQILPTLRMRGSWGTSFRAPDLFEQFLNEETSFVAAEAGDICFNFDRAVQTNGFSVGSEVREFCQGLINDGTLPLSFGTINGPGPDIRVETSGVNINGTTTLEAEEADTWTVGIVFQPTALNLSIGLNWFDIKLDNTISNLGVRRTFEACIEARNTPGREVEEALFCGRVTGEGRRNPASENGDGLLIVADNSFVNLGQQNTSGADLDILYEHEFDRVNLLIDTTITYTHELNDDDTGFGTNVEEFVGRLGFPRWRGEADIALQYDNWLLNWRVDWLGKTEENLIEGAILDPENTRILDTPNKFYHTLGLQYNDDSWNVIFSVRNLLDEDPPIISEGGDTSRVFRNFNTLPGVGYEMLGRIYVLQVGVEF